MRYLFFLLLLAGSVKGQSYVVDTVDLGWTKAERHKCGGESYLYNGWTCGTNSHFGKVIIDEKKGTLTWDCCCFNPAKKCPKLFPKAEYERLAKQEDEEYRKQNPRIDAVMKAADSIKSFK